MKKFGFGFILAVLILFGLINYFSLIQNKNNKLFVTYFATTQEGNKLYGSVSILNSAIHGKTMDEIAALIAQQDGYKAITILYTDNFTPHP